MKVNRIYKKEPPPRIMSLTRHEFISESVTREALTSRLLANSP